ncbi:MULTISPECIES: hypothetical protein [unclassified Nocardiopsis]|uniref:hypothetical protein n=1 Tax=Nocardiopsis TaxID=2013 RepID=UPI00387A9FD6
MAVERVKKRLETHPLGQLRLYRDELEAIAEALAEFGELEFTVNDELTGTEPGDFAKMGDELPERLEHVRMKATSDDAAVVVELGPVAGVGLVEPDMTARGALTAVEKICAPHRMRPPWIWPLLALAAVFVSYSVYAVIQAVAQGAKVGEALNTAVGASALLLVIGFLASLFIIPPMALVLGWGPFRKDDPRSRPRDVILNVPRAERPTFGERLVADGGVSAFWTVVGLVCGGAIGYLVNQLPGL